MQITYVDPRTFLDPRPVFQIDLTKTQNPENHGDHLLGISVKKTKNNHISGNKSLNSSKLVLIHLGARFTSY